MKIKDATCGGFEEAVRLSSRYLYTLSYRLTGSADDAGDLVQDTYVKAFEKWNTLRDRDNPLPWLRKICLRIHIDHCRTPSARHRKREIPFPDPGHEIASGAPTPEEEIILDHDARQIRSQCYSIITSSLGLYQRIVFVLVDIFGIEIFEAAGLMNKTLPAARSALQRARRKITRLLVPICGLVSPDSVCRCASWRALSHDIQNKRAHLRQILSQSNQPALSDAEAKARLKVLFETLPYLNPPPSCAKRVALIIQK